MRTGDRCETFCFSLIIVLFSHLSDTIKLPCSHILMPPVPCLFLIPSSFAFGFSSCSYLQMVNIGAFFKKSVHLSIFLCRSHGKGQDNVFHCEPKFPTQHRGWLTSLWTIQYWGGLPATALIQCEVPLPAISTIQFPTVFDTAPRVFPKSNLKKQCQFMSFCQQIHCSGDQNIQIVHVT